MNRILLVDFGCVCWTCAYAMGKAELTYKGQDTGILFSFMNYMNFLQKNLNPSVTVFCCDHKKSKRRKIFPEYKLKRHTEEDPEKIRFKKTVKRQMGILLDEILPEIGFNNIFMQKGREGDDILAKICKDYHGSDIIMVTSDQDMYQCLSDSMRIFTPRNKVFVTEEDLMDRHELTPKQWVKYKMIGGCTSDEVPGVQGCGPKKTADYILGRLPEGIIKKRIESLDGRAIIKRNKKLVKLPMKGTKTIRIGKNDFNAKKLAKIARKYGMDHIADQCRHWRIN